MKIEKTLKPHELSNIMSVPMLEDEIIIPYGIKDLWRTGHHRSIGPVPCHPNYETTFCSLPAPIAIDRSIRRSRERLIYRRSMPLLSCGTDLWGLPLQTAKFSAEKADGRVRRERQGWEDGGDRNALCKLGSTNFCYKGACLGFDLL